MAELVRPIREAMDLYDLGDDPLVTTRTVAELIAAAEELCARVRATRLHAAAAALPDLITELTALCWRAPTTELWQALASAYRTAHDITVKLGFDGLATVALDRLGWAAERAGDPCLAAMRQYFRGLVYFREGEYSIGLRLVRSGRGLLGSDGSSRAALTVAGQLHLGGSVPAARAGEAGLAAEHIAQAREHAGRVGDASRVHWLNFSSTNVALHEMSVAMEMRRYDEALRQAKAVDRRGAALVRTHGAQRRLSRRHGPLSAAELRGGRGVHNAARAHLMPQAEGRSTESGTRKEMSSAVDARASTASQRIRRAVSPRLAATPDVHHDPQGLSSLSTTDLPLFEAAV
ncbi:hypothetical protein SMICM304S_09710 [Streptomyces microflavus]